MCFSASKCCKIPQHSRRRVSYFRRHFENELLLTVKYCCFVNKMVAGVKLVVRGSLLRNLPSFALRGMEENPLVRRRTSSRSISTSGTHYLVRKQIKNEVSKRHLLWIESEDQFNCNTGIALLDCLWILNKEIHVRIFDICIALFQLVCLKFIRTLYSPNRQY